MNRKTVKIDDNVNFTYHYWMRKYFNLEGVELTVYAIVYNVSCIQDSRLYAGAKYIAELIGSSEHMRSLFDIDMGIGRRRNGKMANARTCR